MFDGIKPLVSADEPAFPKARAFAAHCLSLMDADGLLPASRFELVKIPRLAPYVAILGMIDGGADFQVRLVGTRLVDEFLGRDPTGARLSQILKDDAFGRRSRHIMTEVVRTKRPVLNQPGRARLKEREYMRLETVTFPLVDDAGAVVKIASLYDYEFETEPLEV